MNGKSLFGRLLGLAAAFFAGSAWAGPSLSFAVVPQFSPEATYQAWQPIVDEVGRQTGISLKLKTYGSIPEFEKAFLNGEPDLAYMNPYHAVMARKAQGYDPIVRDNGSRLTGILVVRKDSPITDIRQLDGTTLAFPAPNAFGASLYLRALLSTEAKVRFTSNYVKTHSNVYRHVLIGQAAAGGAVRQTLSKESPEVQEQLRVLYETPQAYAHPITAHPRVSAQVKQAIQKAFLAMSGKAEFTERLKAIQIPEPAAARYADYSHLEHLGLEKFVVLSND